MLSSRFKKKEVQIEDFPILKLVMAPPGVLNYALKDKKARGRKRLPDRML